MTTPLQDSQDIVFDRKVKWGTNVIFSESGVYLTEHDIVFSNLHTDLTDLVFEEEGFQPLGEYDIYFSGEDSGGFDLNFGEEDEPLEEELPPPIPEAVGYLSIPIGGIRPSIVGVMSRYTYYGAIILPPARLKPKVVAEYLVDTFKGLRVSTGTSFGSASIIKSRSRVRTSEAEQELFLFSTAFEDAEKVKGVYWNSASTASTLSTYHTTFYQETEGVKTYYKTASQVAMSVSKQMSVGFQAAVITSIRYSSDAQFTLGVSREWRHTYEKAVYIGASFEYSNQYQTQVNNAFEVNYQNAEHLPNYIYRPPVVIPPDPEPEPEKVQNNDIDFECLPFKEELNPYYGDLIFNDVCQGGAIEPPINVDFLEPYFVKNTIGLINLETGEVIAATAVDFSTDTSSFAWSGSLSVPASEVSKITSPTNKPVLLGLTFNGHEAIFLVQSITKSVSFNNKSYKVSVISPTALLGSPYSREDSFSLEQDAAPQTIIENLIDTPNTGIALDWQYLSPLDWIVKAKTFSYQSLPPIKAIGELVKDSAVFLYSELGSKTLTIKKKRPFAFWETAVDPIILQEAFTSSYSLSIEHHRNYTGVYAISGVSGVEGITAFITRAEYDGAELAPQIVVPPLTSNQALIDVGKYALGTSGVIEQRSLNTPIIEGQPLVKPADVVKFTHEGVTYVGTVLSTGINLKFNSQYQNFVVEVVKGFN